MRSLIVLVFLVGCGSRWTVVDTTMAVVAAGATVADWGQSAAIAHGCLEENIVIGRCGQMAGPHLYFATLLGAGALLIPQLPTWARRVVLVVAGSVEMHAVNHNIDHMSDGWTPVTRTK